MSARSKARKRALDALYAAELRGVPPEQMVGRGPVASGGSPVTPNPYTRTLVAGVVAHQVRIDELLSTYSSGWDLDRMPAVDRNILRIAVYELLWSPDVPAAVVIDEAVAMARELSTAESPAFINGLLAHILSLRPELVD